MTFTPDRLGLLDLEEALLDVDVVLAEAIAERARDFAPVDTGEYRDSIAVVRDDDGVHVIATAPHAPFIELGTADTPAFAPMTRAQDSLVADLVGLLEDRIG